MVHLLFLFQIQVSVSSAEDCATQPGMLEVPKEVFVITEATGSVIEFGMSSRVRVISDSEFPFVGRFRGAGENPSSCTGTLLEGGVVLGVGHCIQELGENPQFVLSRDPLAIDGTATTTLLDRGDDWALYRLDSAIAYLGPYPTLRTMSAAELKDKRLISIGFPVEGTVELMSRFVADESCKVFNTTFVEQKFISNCYTRKGMSGGPLGFFEDGKFSIVAVRQGRQWGSLRKLFNQAGTVETPAAFFKSSYDSLMKDQQQRP